jgi:hypothetical protein
MVGIQAAQAYILAQPLTDQGAGFASAYEASVASAGVWSWRHLQVVVPDSLVPGYPGVVVLS